MAIGKCRECGAEVSDQAKSCPKCGVSNPIKKTSLITKLFLGFIVFGVFANIFVGGSSESSPKTGSNSYVDPKDEVMKSVKISSFNWGKGSFDNIMLLNAKIVNSSSKDVKDIKIECTHSSKSGTVIDRNSKVIYDSIKSGKTLSVNNFNMGFIHSQAQSTSCEIMDVVVL